jgi:hypothetical protein
MREAAVVVAALILVFPQVLGVLVVAVMVAARLELLIPEAEVVVVH